jgi:hypothetical protein
MAAACAPPAVSVVHVDRSTIGPAFEQVLREVRAGARVELEVALDDQPSLLAARLGYQILIDYDDYDRRREAFRLLGAGELVVGETPQRRLPSPDTDLIRSLRELSALAGHLRARSWTAYRRFTHLCAVRPPVAIAGPQPSHDVPAALEVAPARDAVVVWAARRNPRDLSVILFALQEVRREVVVICPNGQPLEHVRCTWLPVRAAGSALARAAVVVDTSFDAPDDAIALRALGLNVVTSSGTGAWEFDPSIRTYRAWDRRTIVLAVLSALGDAPRPTPVCRTAAGLATVPSAGDAPLVSAIVRWHDKTPFDARAMLRRTLESVARQTHGAVEAIVVNNGGAPIEDLVGDYPFARYVRIEATNIADAANRGLELAKGKYAALLDTDDAALPDHYAALAGALERSGGLAAHADIIVAYVGPEMSVSGLAVMQTGGIEYSDLLVQNPLVGGLRTCFRRDVALELGGFRSGAVPADDYDLWLRLARRGDIIRVPLVTGLYSYFTENTNASMKYGASFQARGAVYAMHPVVERPALTERRSRLVEFLRTHGRHGLTPPTVTLKAPVALSML